MHDTVVDKMTLFIFYSRYSRLFEENGFIESLPKQHNVGTCIDECVFFIHQYSKKRYEVVACENVRTIGE